MLPTINHSQGHSESSDSLSLYKEAVARASRPQPIILHSAPKSLLLTSPNNIIFELFNTIINEITLPELNEYITNQLKQYLSDNWSNKALQNAISRLRREREIDKRAKSPSLAPDISTRNKINSKSRSRAPNEDAKTQSTVDQQAESGRSSSKSPSSSLDKQQQKFSESKTDATRITPSTSGIEDRSELINQVYRHIIWRINSQKVTQITSLIIKFAIDDGYKRGRIKAQVYEDVKVNFKDWRSDKLIKLYSFGNLPPNDQRLILANTSVGNLSRYIANYIDGSEKKENNDLIRILASALRDKTKNCIFITNDLDDAIRSLETNALRSVFVVDRDKRYEKELNQLTDKIPQLVFLITSGKLYFISSMNCVQFVPDPTTKECC